MTVIDRVSAPAGRDKVAASTIGATEATRMLRRAAWSRPRWCSIQEANRAAGTWIGANLPRDAVLGSRDAGVVGYFTDQRVVNLGGVVSSFEHLDANTAGTQGDLLRGQHLAYLVNHGSLVNGEDPEIREATTGTIGDATADGIGQVERIEFTCTGTTSGTANRAPTDQMAVFVYRLPD